jgi:hypothetical protein
LAQLVRISTNPTDPEVNDHINLQLEVIIFGSVRFLLKKSNQTEIFFEKKPKPNRNWVKPTGFGLVQVGFLGKKPIQTSLARFFRFWLGFLGFFGLAWFWLGFFGLARFFRFGSVFSDFLSVSVRFFFWFFAYETEPN